MLWDHLFDFFEQFTYSHHHDQNPSLPLKDNYFNVFSTELQQVIHPPNIFVDGYANVSYTHYLPVWVNSLSMANSIFYLICFGLYYLSMAFFLYKIKSRKIELKRNHKLLFVLAIVFVAIQSMTLIIRVVYDGLHLYARIYTESTGNLLRMEFLIALNLMGALTIFFMFSDFIFLFIVLFYFQKIFWTTAKMMGAISRKALSRIQIMLNVTTVIFSVTSLVMVLLAAIFFFFQKTDMVGKPPTTGVYVGCFVVIFTMLVYDAVITIISGVLVMRSIKQTIKAVMTSSQRYAQRHYQPRITSPLTSSSLSDHNVDKSNANISNTTLSVQQQVVNSSHPHSTNDNNTSTTILRTSIDGRKMEQRIQSPFKVTFGLLLGLVACIFFQLLAAGIASAAVEIDVVKMIWYFFNCLGVLVFAVIILCLFYPMFVNTEIAFKEIETSKANALKNHEHVQEGSLNPMLRVPSMELQTPSSPTLGGNDTGTTSECISVNEH
ncbi:hypothetical protein C9374_000881 [Naegleria lovaniensis]|uniref:Uncharacterized protein n=1 Tax=Naegleria lovaniensis TaxID=51637 RepID=A0AA88KNW2_NAELO|nr:uncharacterized protein C9374_000881 [Naegleria lovaniensis]KAG2388031.1 hypothetical protein C9374_000881 [Naegleria lovaniensis]